MIGESGGVTTLVYQEQVGRENQIQRDQGASRETEDNSSRQAQSTADVTSFSAAALELARTAVSSVEATPEVEDNQQPLDAQAARANAEGGSEPAQYLDVRA